MSFFGSGRFGSGLYYGIQPQVDDPTPASPDLKWSLPGGVTDSSAVIVVRLTGVGDVEIEYDSDSGFTSPTTTSPVTADATSHAARVTITGLDDATQYYYRVIIDAGAPEAETGAFKTAPVPGTPYSFNIAAGSCALTDSAHAVWAAIDAESIDMFQHMGDLHYLNIATNTPSSFRSGYDRSVGIAAQNAMYRKRAWDYVWDDHDFGPNDSDSTSASRPAAQQVFRELVPHYDLPTADAIYRAYTRGRVRFIVTDHRYFKSPKNAADNSSKTMLGATQKAWFKAQLLAARDAGLAIAWVSSNTWLGSPQSGADYWRGYTTEREELGNFFQDEGLLGRMYIQSGDIHSLGIDDGGQSNFATVPVGNGPPVFGAAALDQFGADAGSLFNLGSQHNTPTSGGGPFTGQYGLLEFVDTGGDTISVTFSGYSVTAGGTKTLWKSETFALSIEPPPIGAPTITVAATDTDEATVTTTVPGADATDHALYRSTDSADLLTLPISGTFLVEDELTATPSPVVVGSLEPGTHYFRMVASNTEGDAGSTIESVTLTPTTFPPADLYSADSPAAFPEDELPGVGATLIAADWTGATFVDDDDLCDGVTRYYAAYRTNAGGTVRSNVASATTVEAPAGPELDVSAITTTSAFLRLLNVDIEDAAETRYQTTLATDTEYGSVIDDSGVITEDTEEYGRLAYPTQTALPTGTALRSLVEWRADSEASWESAERTWSTLATPPTPPAEDVNSHWIAPFFGQVLAGTGVLRAGIEKPFSMVGGFDISDDDGETWGALGATVTQYDEDADFIYVEASFDTTLHDDGFYRARFTLDDPDIAIVEHYGFHIGNDAPDAVSHQAGEVGMVKYWRPSVPVGLYSVPGGQNKVACAPSCPPASLFGCPQSYPFVGHAGATPTSSNPPPSFGPASPAWVTSFKGGIEVSATMVSASAAGGFSWEKTWPGDNVTLGIAVGVKADDPSHGIRAWVESGTMSGLGSGIMDGCGFNWGAVGKGNGTAKVQIGSHTFSLPCRTAVGYQLITVTKNCGALGCCRFWSCGTRAVPISLRAWQPDPDGDPLRWRVVARFVQALDGGGRGVGGKILSGSINTSTVIIDEEVVLDEPMDCGAVAFFTYRPQGGGALGSGRFVANYSIRPLGAVDTCEPPVIEPNIDYDVEVDCHDVLLTANAGTDLDLVRYRITTAADTEFAADPLLLDTGWIAPEYYIDPDWGLTSAAFHLQEDMEPGEYLALIDVAIGEDEFQSEALPFEVLEFEPAPTFVSIDSATWTDDGILLTFSSDEGARFRGEWRTDGAFTELFDWTDEGGILIDPGIWADTGELVTIRICAAFDCSEEICEDVTLFVGAPCSVYLYCYEPDRETLAWVVSTDPFGPNQYLIDPDETGYGEQQVDFINGRASIAEVTYAIADVPEIAGDQDSGFMTARLADDLARGAVQGRRMRMVRFTDLLSPPVVIIDGPAGAPRMRQSYAGYEGSIRDTRETERKVPAFLSGGTTTLLPMGVLDGFGYDAIADTYMVEPTKDNPLLGRVDRVLSGLPIAGGGATMASVLLTSTPGNDAALRRLSLPAYELLEGQVEILSQTVTETPYNDGGIDYLVTETITEWETHFPRLTVLWRAAGSSDEWQAIQRPRLRGTVIETIDTQFGTSSSGGFVSELAVTVDETDTTRLATRLYFGHATSELPAHNADIEIIVSYSGRPTETTPLHIEGITAGELAARLYDGFYSPWFEYDEYDEPIYIPTGIRYDLDAVLALDTPVRMRITEPVRDLRAWTERHIYAPLGYAPALDNDARISPMPQVMQGDPAALTDIADAITSPRPEWNAGETIVNVVRFTYQRIYKPEVPGEGADGLIARKPIEIENRHEPSVDQHGEQIVEIDGSAFSALGDEDGIALGPELGALLAGQRWAHLGPRYAYGAPTLTAVVMRDFTAHLRAGDWVVADLTWFPDFVTRRRGLMTYMQIVAIRDLNCAWRSMVLEWGPEPADDDDYGS